MTRPILLMTRPLAAARSFVASLGRAAAQCQVIYAPLVQIRFNRPLPDMARFRGLVFTSGNGVRSYVALGGRKDIPAYCVGAATAEAARIGGMRAISADGDSDALVELITTLNARPPLLHIHGEVTHGDVADRLSAAGIPTIPVVLYEQRLLPLDAEARAALDGSAPVIAPLFSPRTARQFATQGLGEAPLFVAALSQAVADAVGPDDLRALAVAERPNASDMARTVSELIETAAMLETRGDAQ